MGSDHHLILAKLRVKLKKYVHQAQQCRQKYQVSLLQNEERRNEFQLELSNRFQALENLEDMDINDLWIKIKEGC